MAERKEKNNMFATGIVDLKFLKEKEDAEAERIVQETAAKIEQTMQAQKSSEK